MDSESIWKKNILFNNGTSTLSKNKNKNYRTKIYQKNIHGVNNLEFIDTDNDQRKMEQKITDVYNKKRRYSKSPILDREPVSYNTNDKVIEGFDLVMDNSGNFQKIEDNIVSGEQSLVNNYSNAMNLTAQYATNAVSTIGNTGQYAGNIVGNTVSSAGTSIGKNISDTATYTGDLIGSIDIHTDLNIVNIISNLIEPRDFADRELEEDLSNNRILFIPPSGASGGCKSTAQPYKPPADKDYNKILNDQYKKSVLGSQDTVDVKAIDTIETSGTEQSLNNSSIASLELEQVANVTSYSSSFIYDNPLIQFFIQNLRIIEFPFIYYKWFIKKIGIMWCNVIYTLCSSFYTNKYSKPNDTEKRMVIANLNSILCFLFSVLFTYNWFFLMFYEYNGEKVDTYSFSSEKLKNFSGFLNFIFEFVIYPLQCMNWLMLRFIPKWVLRLLNTNMNIVFILTYVFFSVSTLSSVGPATIDLFYDSLKLFFNHTLKPWQPIMMHTYTSFWKSFYIFGKRTKTNPVVKYSVTLSTYVFLHIMIFYAQLPSLIPSFFKKPEAEGGSSGNFMGDAASNLGSGLSSLGTGLSNAASDAAGTTAALGSAALGAAGSLGSAIGDAASGISDIAEKKKEHSDTKKEPAHGPAPAPAPHPAPAPRGIGRRRGGALPKIPNVDVGKVGSALGTGLGAAGTAAGAISGLSRFLPGSSLLSAIPGSGMMSSLGSAMNSSFAGTFLGALGSVIIAFIRFCISQYLVNLSAFFIAFYLLWYSFFGISWFSKLGLFKTIKEIDIFVLKHSMDYVYETCVKPECKEQGIWASIQRIFKSIASYTFPLIFYITILFILVSSCIEYTNIDVGIKSSPYLKYGMLISTIIVLLLIVIKGYVSLIHNKK